MKRIELIRHLSKQGCELLREGGRHSIWKNIQTGDKLLTKSKAVLRAKPCLYHINGLFEFKGSKRFEWKPLVFHFSLSATGYSPRRNVLGSWESCRNSNV